MPAFVSLPPTSRSIHTCSSQFLCRRPLHKWLQRKNVNARPISVQFPCSMNAMNEATRRKPDEANCEEQDRQNGSEDTFVLEEVHQGDEDMLTESDEDERRTVWNKLPSTRNALLSTSYLTDIVLVLAIVALVYGLAITTGSLFSSAPYSALSIDTSIKVLPWYAAQSLTRMLAGYSISFVFSLVYAYIAYRVKFAAKLLMLVIDVLQSIPLLSFLPGVVLGLISLFPDARIGVELAAVLLLFTSMAWNMLLGFYQSLSCIPCDLQDVSKSFRLSPWKRFWVLELPVGAIGLVWNSIISIAGGWFFLICIESFELGNRDFKLPGIGSYLAVAAETSNYTAIFAGLSVIIAIIVFIDFILWRPLIAWSTKFTYGSTHEDNKPRSMVLNALQTSTLVRKLHATVLAPAWESFVNMRIGNSNMEEGKMHAEMNSSTNSPTLMKKMKKKLPYIEGSSGAFFSSFLNLATRSAVSVYEMVQPVLAKAVPIVVVTCMSAGVGYGVWQAGGVLRVLPMKSWIWIGTAAMTTFARVLVALTISLLWTVPAGVAIGRNPKLSAKLQPIVQIAASVPATALFPFVLLFLARLGGGLEIGSIALMMLGTMWYILFNVIAGAQAMPSELFEVDSVYNRDGVIKRWRTLILPGIFPYLITGVVTAVGGAWNASIVSEYVVFQGGVLKTHGLGSLISEAAASGNYGLLLGGTLAMSVLVLLTNKFVWGPLYQLAETKYRI